MIVHAGLGLTVARGVHLGSAVVCGSVCGMWLAREVWLELVELVLLGAAAWASVALSASVRQ